MTTYNFSANDVDFGDWEADSLTDAKNAFASGAGYISWSAMHCLIADNQIEIRRVGEDGNLELIGD